MRERWRPLKWLIGLIIAALPTACGSRSGLLSDRSVGEPDAGAERDASVERDASAPKDAAPDRSEAAVDAPLDVKSDGLPPCDPEALFVYLVTSDSSLFRYHPVDGTFFKVGTLDCPGNGTPFSMGVSRTGTAYVLHRPSGVPSVNPPGQLYAANVGDASCVGTGFMPGQEGFNLFGMGFAIDDDGMGETLYVASSGQQGGQSKGLGSIDLSSMQLDFIGAFSQNPGNRVELTSADDGQLYGYFVDPNGNGGYVVRIDKTTAAILEVTPIAVSGNSDAFAFAYWGGDFYVFTAPLPGPTTVTRYRPSDGSLSVVASLAETVVGAGVSTCAPGQDQ